tara:strand:- start:5942 stop:6148 length:207 start_codon:yes stop_codon:yes gene_type:complete
MEPEPIAPEQKEKSFVQRHFSVLSDLWNFMRIRKKFWLLPTILMLVLVGGLIIFGQSTGLSPFIYALF